MSNADPNEKRHEKMAADLVEQAWQMDNGSVFGVIYVLERISDELIMLAAAVPELRNAKSLAKAGELIESAAILVRKHTP